MRSNIPASPAYGTFLLATLSLCIFTM
jgi:hypothetical protein